MVNDRIYLPLWHWMASTSAKLALFSLLRSLDDEGIWTNPSSVLCLNLLANGKTSDFVLIVDISYYIHVLFSTPKIYKNYWEARTPRAPPVLTPMLLPAAIGVTKS